MMLTVVENVTLDGVMQSPGRPDEDTRGGFTHGGWGTGYQDAVMAAEMGRRMARPGALVLGRRTYQDLFASWAGRTDGNPFTEHFKKVKKYVASRTLRETLPWDNSVLLEGDAAEAVARLKQDGDEDLGVLGSGELVASLMARNLVDEYVLLIYPLVLGTGHRLFPNGLSTELRLVGCVPTGTGVLIATYRPA